MSLINYTIGYILRNYPRLLTITSLEITMADKLTKCTALSRLPYKYIFSLAFKLLFPCLGY